MGVHGLWKYLRGKIDLEEEYLAKNELQPLRLLIDGNGWIFHIVGKLVEIDFREFGGFYEKYHSSIMEEVGLLRDHLGFDIVVYFDGKSTSLKDETADKRNDTINLAWTALFNRLHDRENCNQSDLPIPPLLGDQMLATLALCGVKMLMCTGEADQEIAIACAAENKSCPLGEEKCFIYANDTDFVAMKDCLYIPFGGIRDLDESGDIPVSCMLRRSFVADALGLTESQFVDLCIVMGNDYTDHFLRNDFTIDTSHCPSVSHSHSVETTEKLRNWVASTSPEQRLTSSNHDLRARIEYSRALYDLEDLTNLTFPESHYHSDPSKVSFKELSEEEKGGVSSWLTGLDRGLVARKGRGFTGLLGLAFLTHTLKHSPRPGPESGDLSPGLGNHRGVVIGPSFGLAPDDFTEDAHGSTTNGAATSSFPNGDEEGGKDLMFSYVSDIHLRACWRMLERLGAVEECRRGASGVGPAALIQLVQTTEREIWDGCDADGAMLASAPGSRKLSGRERVLAHEVLWEDALAALQFQLVCKAIARVQCSKLEGGGSETSYLSVSAVYAPQHVFDGEMFHSILRSLRRDKAAAPKGPHSGPLEGPKLSSVDITDSRLRSPLEGGREKSRALDVTRETKSDADIAGNHEDLYEGGSFEDDDDDDDYSQGDAGADAGDQRRTEFNAANKGAVDVSADPPPRSTRDVLPVDGYRDEIIRRVGRDRVTIIHGETGCGKSSRLPVILMEHLEETGRECRMMISQPRRIAASSLMKRLRTTLGAKVGMRMGFGIKDESEETCIHFVTTGYLVRLLAHHPEAFSRHTHLIIDEVHERSVDGDLLCLLARKLLEQNSTIRLVLMSATIHTELYKQYFNQEFYYGDMDVLSVGVRRFPLEIKYLDDLASPGSHLPPTALQAVREMMEAMKGGGRGGQVDAIIAAVAKKQYATVLALVRKHVVPGTGVLIFVSGIADITDLAEKFEGLSRFRVVAIHSDIPFEEQETAFLPVEPDEIKVIIATNAAESSITLPDVDCVICLGTHKALQYDSVCHRVQLVNTWISKASATQRAGRTGRVRPGKVFRLYSRQLHESFREHEESEIHRKPLQDIILGLRNMLEESAGFDGVVPILEDLLEPPEMENVERSFANLYENNMISAPDDDGELTAVGRLAAQLPVDIRLGRLIAFGVNLGVGPEAVIMASALSLPKALFRVASPFIHTDPDEVFEIVRTTFLGALALDNGMYSEPLMHIPIFVKWRELDQQAAWDWTHKLGLVYSRVRQFASSTRHLLERVNDALSLGRSYQKQAAPLTFDTLTSTIVSPLKQNMLRLALVWNSDGGMLMAKPPRVKLQSEFYTVTPMQSLSNEQLKKMFDGGDVEVEWELDAARKAMYDAKFADTSRTLFQILEALVKSSRAPVVWLHQRVSDDDDDDAVASRRGSKKKQRQSDNSGNLVIAMLAAEDIPACGDAKAQKAYTTFLEFFQHSIGEFRAELAGEMPAEDADASTSKAPNGAAQLGRYDVYIVQNPSKRAMTWWKQSHNMLSKSVSMVIPAEGNCKITDNSCELTQPALARLFFGSEAESVSTDPKNFHIAEQIVATKQVIVFPNPFDKALESQVPSAKNRAVGKKAAAAAATSDEDEPKEAPPKPLIRDIPLGMRLLNAFKAIYKDKKLRIWSPKASAGLGVAGVTAMMGGMAIEASQSLGQSQDLASIIAAARSASASAPLSTLVPGSAEWNKHKQAEQKKGEDGIEDAPVGSREREGKGSNLWNKRRTEHEHDHEEVVSINLNTVSCTWVNIIALGGAAGTPGGEPQAMLSRQGVLGVAAHLGREELYGVAFNTRAMGAEGRQVFADGVTFLPIGSRWLALALLCAGKDATSVIRRAAAIGSSVGANDMDGGDGEVSNSRRMKAKHVAVIAPSMATRCLSDAEADLCEGLVPRLQALGDQPIRLAPDVLRALCDIFRDWVGDVSSTGAAGKEVDDIIRIATAPPKASSSSANQLDKWGSTKPKAGARDKRDRDSSRNSIPRNDSHASLQSSDSGNKVNDVDKPKGVIQRGVAVPPQLARKHIKDLTRQQEDKNWQRTKYQGKKEQSPMDAGNAFSSASAGPPGAPPYLRPSPQPSDNGQQHVSRSPLVDERNQREQFARTTTTTPTSPRVVAGQHGDKGKATGDGEGFTLRVPKVMVKENRIHNVFKPFGSARLVHPPHLSVEQVQSHWYVTFDRRDDAQAALLALEGRGKNRLRAEWAFPENEAGEFATAAPSGAGSPSMRITIANTSSTDASKQAKLARKQEKKATAKAANVATRTLDASLFDGDGAMSDGAVQGGDLIERGRESFPCATCAVVFASASERTHHMTIVHGLVAPLTVRVSLADMRSAASLHHPQPPQPPQRDFFDPPALSQSQLHQQQQQLDGPQGTQGPQQSTSKVKAKGKAKGRAQDASEGIETVTGETEMAAGGAEKRRSSKSTPSTRPKHTCDTCGREFNNPGAKNQHRRDLHKETLEEQQQQRLQRRVSQAVAETSHSPSDQTHALDIPK